MSLLNLETNTNPQYEYDLHINDVVEIIVSPTVENQRIQVRIQHIEGNILIGVVLSNSNCAYYILHDEIFIHRSNICSL